VGGWRLWLRWSWRDLRARWLMVLAIAGVIAIGTGLATGLGSMETWRVQSNDASFAALNAHDLRVALADGSYAPAGELADAIRAVPGAGAIAHLDERLVIHTQIDVPRAGAGLIVPATLYGVPVGPGARVDAVRTRIGRPLGPANSGTPDVLLDVLFARTNDLPPTGTLVAANGARLRYVGLATSPDQFVRTTPTGILSSSSGYGVVYAPLPTAQRIAGLPGRVNEAVLTLRDPRASATVARQIERVFAANPHLAQYGATVTRKSDEHAYTVLYEDAHNDQRVFTVFTILVLFAAALAAFSLISRVVESQRREIGVGMSLGVPPWTLAVRPLLLGIQIALLGVALGVVAGVVIGAQLVGVVRQQTALPVLRTGFQAAIFARGATIGLLVPIAATLYPVWRGIRTTPVDAIRTGPRAARGAGLATLLRTVPLPGRTMAQMPVRNLLRTPRRSGMTLLAITAVITIVISFAGMVDSFGATVDRGREVLLSSAPARVEVSLTAPTPLTAPATRAILDNPLAAHASAGIVTVGRLSANGHTINVGLSLLPDHGAVWLPTPTRGRLPRRANEIMLSEKASRDLGVGVGGVVVLYHPKRSGSGSFRLATEDVVVAGLHASPVRATSYMAYGAASPAFGLAGAVNSIAIQPRTGVSANQIERALVGHPDVASVRAVAATIDDLARAVAEFRGIIQVAEVAALILSLLIAFNATSINVEERRRDVATMFAFGMPVRKVVRVGVIENTIIGLLGTLAGIALGQVVLDWIVHSLFPRTFPDIQVVTGIAPESVAVAFLVGVVAMAAAPLMVVGRLRTMDVPSTLRIVE
jgi:putative ABC transport system permease protein